MSIDLSLNTRQIVHHGAEAAAFITVGTCALSSFSAACIAYGVGKVTYLSTKALLHTFAPNLSLDAKRTLSWSTSLLTGGTILHVNLSEAAGKSASAFTTILTTAGVTVASIGIRTLADKSLKHLNTPQNPLPSARPEGQKKQQ